MLIFLTKLQESDRKIDKKGSSRRDRNGAD